MINEEFYNCRLEVNTVYDPDSEVPVYELDQAWFDSDCAYPGVWVTRPEQDVDDEYYRGLPVLYPTGCKDDPEGHIAFSLGADYYNEAMGYVDARDHQKRIECFKAAEILYLNAAERGNMMAVLSLGYVYSYDRCEGRYFQDVRERDAVEKVDHQARAFECFRRAADCGITEAYYKLGDMYEMGIGCEEDPAKAFEMYARAHGEAHSSDMYARSGAALRLGSCFERAYGCERNVELALCMYEEAELFFERIVATGDWFYEKSLARAQKGVTRMTQEARYA